MKTLLLLAAGAGFSRSYLGICQEAVKHLKEGRPLWAVSLLSLAKEEAPHHPLAWSLSGAGWALAGRWEDCAQQIARAKRQDPSDPLACFLEALLRLRGGDFERASRAFDEAMKSLSLPGEGLALASLAKLLSGDLEGAVALARKVEGFLVKAVLALALAASGRWEEASRVAKEALSEEGQASSEKVWLNFTLDLSLSGEPKPGWSIEEGRKALASLEEPAPLPPPKRLRLPQGLKIGPVQPDGTVKGEVTISGVPSQPGRASFVSIKIDEKVVYLSNAPPFEFVWDTRLFKDGEHRVSFVCFSRDGSVLEEKSVEVEVRNQEKEPCPPEKVAELEGEVLKLLVSEVRVSAGKALNELTLSLSELSRVVGEAMARLGASLFEGLDWKRWPKNLSQEGREKRTGLKLGLGERFEVEASFVPQPRVILILDDGPHPEATPLILEILDRYGIKATFFLTGEAVERYPELAREIRKRGHEIGGHGYTGRRLHLLPRGEMEAEIKKTVEVIKEVCGVDIRLFRPPGERMSEVVRRVVEAFNLRIVGYHVQDWPFRHLPPEEAARRILSHVSEGKIILLHNGPHVPVALVEAVIRGLVRAGYKPVGVSEFQRGQP